MSTHDDKGRVERAFGVILAEEVAGIQVISGSDRETIADPIRISVTATPESVPGCEGFPCDVEILIVTPDTVTAANRADLVRQVETVLRAFEPLRVYVPDPAAEVTIAGFAIGDTADESSGRMNGDLIKIKAGIVRGDN